MNITRQATDALILGELGGRIAKTRLDHNLTQAQLAAEAGVLPTAGLSSFSACCTSATL